MMRHCDLKGRSMWVVAVVAVVKEEEEEEEVEGGRRGSTPSSDIKRIIPSIMRASAHTTS